MESKTVVLRVGDLVQFWIQTVVEYGTDKEGDFAVVVFGEDVEDEGVRVRGFDFEATGVDVVILGNPEAGESKPVDAGGSNGKKSKRSASAAGTDADAGSAPVVNRSPHGSDPIDGLVDRVADLDPKPVQPIMVRETLNVRLTKEERDESARTASVLMGELNAAEERFKNESNAHKARVKELEAEISAEIVAHNTGLRFRDVSCEQVFDQARGRTWFIYRGEVYNERDMTSHEMREAQRTLFGDGPILPNKVDPSALPHPSQLAGDQLAKRMNNDGSGRDVEPEIAGAKVEKSKRDVGAKRPGKRKAPMVVESIRAANGADTSAV